MLADLHSLDPGEHRLTCPSCARGPKDKTYGATVAPGGAAVGHCFRCGHTENHWPDRGPACRPGKAIVRPVAASKRETLSEYGVELFESCVGLRGTVGETYLLTRGCVIPPADGDLRFDPALKHPASDHVGPALVALVTHAETRTPLSLHRTWIRAGGHKADIEPNRMLLGGHSKRHGVVRLWPDESVSTGLCVGEGLETCLSMAHAFTPVWSCIDAGNLAALPALVGIEALTIGADHDDVGITAARDCARRWFAAGREVRIACAPAVGADMNDVLQEANA